MKKLLKLFSSFFKGFNQTDIDRYLTNVVDHADLKNKTENLKHRGLL